MVLGKLVFRGERKKFFLYGENKKKKEIETFTYFYLLLEMNL